MPERLVRNFASRLRRDPAGAALLLVVVAIIAMCIMAPLVTSADPIATDFARMLLPPSAEHPLGTDDFGRDVFARLLYGGRTSLAVSAVAAAIVMGIGVSVGIAAGYFGGTVDLLLTKVIDVLLAFPRLVLAIAVAALMGGGTIPLVIAISAVAWPAYARIIRGYTMQISQEGYVQAARVMGTSAWKVLGHHVALNLIGPILVLGMLDLGNLILAISALSFLGLGIAPPAPEWGSMLNEGRAMMEIAPWQVLAPGTAIFAVVLAANYLGDIVRDSTEGRPVHGPRDWLRLRRSAPRWCDAAEVPASFGPRVTGERPALPSAPLLAFESVRVDVTDPRSPYFGRRILNDVSLSVWRGECVGLIGESGSGKSTLAALALGLTRPPLALTSGGISIRGAETGGWSWDDWRDVRGRDVALVSQDPLSALNPVLRVGEQIGEAMAVHGDAAAAAVRARTREVLAEVGLPAQVVDRYPHELSGGMCQRVAIAMAIINRPSVLIADEPTTALDVSTQVRILDLLRALQQRHGLALLFVSHDLRVVSRMADRMVILREGRVVEEGPAARVFARPRERYTRELLDAIPGRRRLASPASNPPPMLSLDGMSKVYRRRVAVSEVSFGVGSGEIVGLVGVSGSGKSTIAKCILGLERPDRGTITWRGVSLADRGVRRLACRNIQAAFQDPRSSLNPRWTVRRILSEPLDDGAGPIRRMDRAARLGALLEQVSLSDDLLARYPHELSTGQCQRVCIARALAPRPELLVLDEPLSALDVSVQARILRFLGDIHRQTGVSLLLITHDFAVVREICQRVVVLDGGRVVEAGRVDMVLDHSVHAATRALLQNVLPLPGMQAAVAATGTGGRAG